MEFQQDSGVSQPSYSNVLLRLGKSSWVRKKNAGRELGFTQLTVGSEELPNEAKRTLLEAADGWDRIAILSVLDRSGLDEGHRLEVKKSAMRFINFVRDAGSER